MKSRLRQWIMVLLSAAMLFVLTPAAALAASGGMAERDGIMPLAAFDGAESGSGTESDPYLIANPEQFAAFRDYVNGPSDDNVYFKLTANIDLSGYRSWQPIGNHSYMFNSVLDGDGHTVSGLDISAASEDSFGLFGVISYGGAVKNLTVEGGIDCSGDHSIIVGGIAGRSTGTIENCESAVSITSDAADSVNAGGIVGDNEGGGTIKGCRSLGAVEGKSNGGGIAGTNYGVIENCRNAGSVKGGESADVGGIVGRNNKTVANCLNTASGSVEGSGSVGGIAGYNDGGGTVDGCENSGLVSGSGICTGGIAGYNDVIVDYDEDDDEGDGIVLINAFIRNCRNSGRIIATGGGGGGIVGNNYSYVENCRNAGSVSGSGEAQFIGGIIGKQAGAPCTGCINGGDVTLARPAAGGVAGGIAGQCIIAGDGSFYYITGCYNTGTVKSSGSAGGIAGDSGSVRNCYNTGNISGAHAGGIAGELQPTCIIKSCYYLDTCGAAGEGTAKTSAAFASGEVAWLLQSAADEAVWGQTVGRDSSPLLTDAAEKTVYKVAFRTEEDPAYATAYANPVGISKMPDAPKKEGYTFVKWSVSEGGGEAFTSSTAVSSDMTVYAVFEKNAATSAGDSSDPAVKPDKPAGSTAGNGDSDSYGDTPRTGDARELAPWLMLMALALAVAAAGALIRSAEKAVAQRQAADK